MSKEVEALINPWIDLAKGDRSNSPSFAASEI
jgi:hypothetical protein